MHEPHTSAEFDELLDRSLGLVVQMGARVERQVSDAIECLDGGSLSLIEQVLRHEPVINELERAVDSLATQILARRTPTAGDLRLVLALIKTTTDLERIGDEAKKIALRARSMSHGSWPARPRQAQVGLMASLALGLVRQATQALERLDAAALDVAAVRETALDDAWRAVLRELISYMIEDPRTISGCLDLLFIAKSFERMGDHATNVLEHVVYAVRGEDLRHSPPFSA